MLNSALKGNPPFKTCFDNRNVVEYFFENGIYSFKNIVQVISFFILDGFINSSSGKNEYC